MRTEKGITLISLTVYIIAMIIVVAVVAVISGYFYKNTQGINKNIDPLTEYTKFSTFFSDEVNHENIKVLECETNYIVFDNGVQYTFVEENNAVYRNKVKICSEVQNCNFVYQIKNGKAVIKVTFEVNGKSRETTFTLKN